MSSVEVPDEPSTKYSHGEAEWYAQVMGQAMRDADHSVAPMRNGCEPPPLQDAVIKAIRAKHGAQADLVIKSLTWYGDYWGYSWAGMFCGVETDGYIHT